MTLSSKLTIKIALLIIGLVLLAGASLWGLLGLRGYSDSALSEYAELRSIYEIGWHAATARVLCQAENVNRDEARNQINRAIDKLDLYFGRHAQLADAFPEKHQALLGLRDNLEAARVALQAPPRVENNPVVGADPVQYLAGALRDVMEIYRLVSVQIELANDAAKDHLRRTIVVIAFVSLGMVLGGIAIGLSQHRVVMDPLRRISAAVQSLARGNFDERVELVGDREFIDLARDFNRMASQLDELYNDLEYSVRVKSRELVRSERLASVGFLAAGVAHEINNPLSIISGYAEATLQRLRRLESDDPTHKDMERALRIVCEEAFRCKEITQKLLSMSRTGEGRSARATVELDKIAQEVVGLIQGLRKYRDRRVRLEFSDVGQLTVFANANELKQVLLNLTLNGLEVVAPKTGEVVISGYRDADRVIVVVADNGKGMTPEMLEHIFEPFYTAKRGCEEHGTGLGLSIAHAIVTDHNGRIFAESDGPNRGSRFIIDLPAVEPARPTIAAAQSSAIEGVNRV